MFFEGWHEIEHDMRYKTNFADDAFWKGNPDLSRILNCIVANLELCDWSMIHLFDQIFAISRLCTYRSFKIRIIKL